MKNLISNTISNTAVSTAPSINTNLTKSYLGYSRNDCKQLLAIKNIDSVAFGHWLAIPSLQLLLIFRHQLCIAVDCYSSAAYA